jgi:UDP-2,3-diacylglucosamine hydrolase
LKTLFISDLHLDPREAEVTNQFLDFLKNEAPGADALYILGDLFEVWLGDDDPEPSYRATLEALRKLTAGGVPCKVMHGNRDFLIGQRFCEETGAELIDDGTIVTLYGESAVLMHGDLLCTDDTSYQRLRRIVRNPAVKWIFRHMSLKRRRRLAERMREGSRSHTNATAPQIMDVNSMAVMETFRRTRATTLVHGHTHRPAIHDLEVDGRTARRIVLGDWHSEGSVLEWRIDGVELRGLPR